MALLSPLRRAAIICAGEPSEPSKSEPYAVAMAFHTALKAAPGAPKKFLSAADTSRSVSTITSEPTMRAVRIASVGTTSGCRMRCQRAGTDTAGGVDTAWVKVSPPIRITRYTIRPRRSAARIASMQRVGALENSCHLFALFGRLDLGG